ncbi:MAG: NAD(P)/FAD-dependent oxidoreductase [Bacteroidales bacterium]|nr:NAD(P)/FAD-dependent oxidoreductase [Bacteroidales bacterium]
MQTNIPDNRKKVVVIGGGFAGINLVKRLDKKKYDIVLVDRNNYHSFPPLFYQIASCGLDADNICFPLRREMQKSKAKGTRYHMGEVQTIDITRKEVVTQFETLPYDYLVIAAGCTNNFFGNPDLVKYVYTLKSANEAMRVRNHILDRLERACLAKHDPEKRRKLLSFVVVGGGPTGVEMAGALGEMKRDIIPREYTSLDPNEVKIILLEGTDRLLGTMSKESSENAEQYLKKLLVDVNLGVKMDSYEDFIVKLSNGQEIYSESVIWTAGITGVTFKLEGTDVKPGRGNRFVVDRYNRVVGLDGVFALGDISYMETEDFPHGLPQLAQVAIQQSQLLAKQLNSERFIEQFKYNDKGSMATIGRNLAVADLNHAHLKGFPAWLIWMFIHLISLLGMRNKITVLVNWIWAYFSYSTSLRLLFHTTRYPLRTRWGERGEHL